jgi:hypothetical protein
MKVAIKSLTASDLSLFKRHAERASQRAIALDGHVFVDDFYPGLRESFEQVCVSLGVIGPGGNGPRQLSRRLQRLRGSRNWHLGGELIYDSDDEPARYSALAVGDYCVLAFEGAGRPTVVTLVLVSVREDSRLHEAISNRFSFTGADALVAVPEALVAELQSATKGAYAEVHPLEVLGYRDTVEDVLFGSRVPPRKARQWSTHLLPMSHTDLRRQLLAAEESGEWGEDLFGMWLIATGHGAETIEWVARTQVRSVFDYEVLSAQWIEGAPHLFVIVKTTSGPVERPIHLSGAELRFAASVENCRIARLYGLGGGQPRLRILSGVMHVAQRVIAGLRHLPEGVSAESIQIDSGMFETELEAALT